MKRRLIIPTTFISIGTPTALDTSTHTVKRRFRLSGTFVDVFDIAAWLIVKLGGIALGNITVSMEAKPAANGTWGNGDLWGFSEDA